MKIKKKKTLLVSELVLLNKNLLCRVRARERKQMVRSHLLKDIIVDEVHLGDNN